MVVVGIAMCGWYAMGSVDCVSNPAIQSGDDEAPRSTVYQYVFT